LVGKALFLLSFIRPGLHAFFENQQPLLVDAVRLVKVKGPLGSAAGRADDDDIIRRGIDLGRRFRQALLLRFLFKRVGIGFDRAFDVPFGGLLDIDADSGRGRIQTRDDQWRSKAESSA
jgi:hypothetical protein